MTTLISFLIFCQALGAIVGACTAVWSELSYIRAIRDGRVDAGERAHLAIIARGLRVGMMLLLISSLGLVIVAYVLHATPQPALTPAYWTLVVFAILIVGVSWALSRGRISFKLGSAVIFTAWWLLVFLSFGLLPLSFGAAVMFFVVATAIFYAVLYYARLLASPR